ncbi:Rha family transcriptional regulator [Mycolicibacterium llatzerense]|uniref:Rha family transcriptional regulator n=1 Tax=Mycolicibacterium llatzerense TaxID=280871 RepID=UPI0021B68C49|nr:Rha family transcriptional regulator [Mycolicibacterium llatzerense]
MSADDFAALEHATPIVQVADGVATTTSMRIANGTGNEHASVLLLIRKNLDDFNEFGLVRFEIAPRPAGQHGGGDVSIAVLNEEHATLLLTYMRNTPIVRDFKKRLVREFYAMRKALAEAGAPLHGPELVAAALV